MVTSKILVAYDGSELGNKALCKAIEFAQLNASVEIVVLHVVNNVIFFADTYIPVNDSYLRDNMKLGEDIIREAQQMLSQLPNKSSAFVMEGMPGETIVDVAGNHHCDLIIMGSRGLSGLKELFLGSVSHHVVQHSPVPVLIVK